MIYIEGKLLEENGGSINCSISGSAELIAFEYAAMTKQLLNDKKRAGHFNKSNRNFREDNEGE